MSKIFPLLILLLIHISGLKSQDCNKLGAWLWYIEITGFDSHKRLADTLASLGVKRIYVKVADGQVNTAIWPELTDTALVKTYVRKGIEPWAWSYNYPGNAGAQAQALSMAIQTGYLGYVVDVEEEFDGKPLQAGQLFAAFRDSLDQALQWGWVHPDFKLYCTTWGNPEDHNFPVSAINPYVDAFMPQTYVENWGQTYIQNMLYWIEYGNQEFRRSGATKPLHHIISTEKDKITGQQINEFFRKSGPESSIWVIPGSNTHLNIWKTWRQVDWHMDFCVSGNEDISVPDGSMQIIPNPSSKIIQIKGAASLFDRIYIQDAYGRIVKKLHIPYERDSELVDISDLNSGMYFVRLYENSILKGRMKFVKIE